MEHIHKVKTEHLTAASCPRWIPPAQTTFFMWPLHTLLARRALETGTAGLWPDRARVGGVTGGCFWWMLSKGLMGSVWLRYSSGGRAPLPIGAQPSGSLRAACSSRGDRSGDASGDRQLVAIPPHAFPGEDASPGAAALAACPGWD